jgi:hypothetical protein
MMVKVEIVLWRVSGSNPKSAAESYLSINTEYQCLTMSQNGGQSSVQAHRTADKQVIYGSKDVYNVHDSHSPCFEHLKYFHT